jgi:hypothetical protein
VRLGEKATEVLRRLEERPGFPGVQQHEYSGLWLGDGWNLTSPRNG